MRRIVRGARPLATPDWLDPLWEISDRLGLDEPPRLLRSDEARMPFACGVARPTIVLPAASDGWTLDRRRAVLLHELAHVRRRDLAGHTLARIVCAVYWFHPLVWTAAKRLRAESEGACDDMALACGARAADYAEHLLDIVTSVRRDQTPLVALAMARHTEFEGRMLAILDGERPRATPTRRQSASLVGVLALVTVLVGIVAPVPTVAAAAVATPDGAAVLQRRAPAGSREQQAPHDDALPDEAQRDAVDPARRLVPPTRAAGDTSTPTDRTANARASGNASSSAVANAAVNDTVNDAVNDAVSVAMREERVVASVVASELRTLVERGPQARSTHAGDDERATLLARVLRTDSSASLRRIAAWGLAEYAERPVASAALAVALRGDRSADVREMAAWALADGRGDAAVRATAAWALGNVGDRASVDALTAALRDRGAEVRTRAVWALGQVEPREAPAALLAMLGDPDARVRELTAWALYTIEDPASIPALEAALHTERDAELQLAYVRALATLGEQSVPALRGLLESPDARVKSMAVRALAGGRAAGPWPQPWPEPRPSP